MIRVLHTLPALDGGGAEKIVFDYCIRMMDGFHFDFLVHTEYKGILEERLESFGCKIYHVPPLHKNKKEYRKQIKEILKNGKYDIIHVSQGYKGIYFLYYAKRYKIQVRIAHSHMAYIPESKKDRIIRFFTTFWAKYCATDFFACGQDAAKWMWGKKRNVYIMRNAIVSSDFVFDNEKRKRIRDEFSLANDKIVIGNVARFSFQKNHEYLLSIFQELVKLHPDSVLMLVGRGELFEEVQEKAKELGIREKVLFLGVRDDVSDLLNAMDAFVLPSRFEGLPVTLVEVQANGMPVWVSDNVTKEIRIASNMTYMSINENAKKWAEDILGSELKRKEADFQDSEYDIDSAAKKLAMKYSDLRNARE